MNFILFSKKTLFLILLSVSIFCFSGREVKAEIEDNIRGWAYHEKYGYISMNCLDDDFAGRFPFTFSFMFNIEPCSFSHGVNLSDDNIFSGEAWNPVLRFITFTSNATPPDNRAFANFCENPSLCTAATNCIACYNENTQKVYGYMRVVSNGNWIKLNTDPSASAVSISNYLAEDPGYFSGYAYHTEASSSIGFSCKDTNSCATNPYQVKIGPLEIRQQTSPNWNGLQACSDQGTKRAVLGWNIRSGVQSAYHVIVSTQNSTSSGVVLNTNKIISIAKQYDVPATALNFNTPYYWFLRLWDSEDNETPWRQFSVGTSKDLLTDNNAANAILGNNKTFSTYRHSFPRPFFTWSPTQALIATSTEFASNSSYYDNANNLLSCGSNCTYNWETSDSRATISSLDTATTSIVFARPTSSSVTLTVDDGLYYCATSTILNVEYQLPIWKEIKAQ